LRVGGKPVETINASANVGRASCEPCRVAFSCTKIDTLAISESFDIYSKWLWSREASSDPVIDHKIPVATGVEGGCDYFGIIGGRIRSIGSS